MSRARRDGRFRERKSTGMALISVLLVTVVMLGLAGAFFVAHKSDLALMTSAGYREQTKNCCLSVADFVQYKLQNDRRFGMAAFSSNNRLPEPESFPAGSPNPVLEVKYVGNGSDPSRNVIKGKLIGSGVAFEVELLNNLDGKTSLVLDAQRTTPPRTARAWVSAQRGNLTQNIDFILKRSPFTNASITSGQDIDVQLTNATGGKWLLGARQPAGNAVRASGNITGPEVGSSTSRAVEFTPPPGMEAKLKPPYGVISGKNMTMQVDGVPTLLNASDPRLKDLETNVSGILSPGSGSVKVPELDAKDLQGPAQKVKLSSSNFVFKTVQGQYGPVHILTGDGDELARYNPALDGSDNLESRFFSVPNDDGEGKAVRFDLESRVMTVSENVEVQTGGSFQLSAQKADGRPDTGRQPTLVLGTNEKGASVDSPGVNIQGSVGGKGALKSSKGDLTIAAKSNLSTTPDFGIALHAERDVVLTKPGTNANDGLAVDFDVFARGYTGGTAAQNATIDTWYDKGEGVQLKAAADFQTRPLAGAGGASSFDSLWIGLTKDFPADSVALATRNSWLRAGVPAVTGPDPNWVPPVVDPTVDPPLPVPTAPIVTLTPEVPAGPGVSVEKYVRLREYLRTVKSGAPDPTWLESADPAVQAQRSADVTQLVKNQLSAYQLSAGQRSVEEGGEVTLVWRGLGEYLGKPNPYLGAFTPDLVFRGLVYAGRDFLFDTENKGIYIEGALVTKGNVLIKRATGAQFVYNSDLLENLFATDKEDTSVALERAYWAFY